MTEREKFLGAIALMIHVAEGRLQDAEHEYKLLRDHQRKEKPTLADLVVADARRPVR